MYVQYLKNKTKHFKLIMVTLVIKVAQKRRGDLNEQ